MAGSKVHSRVIVGALLILFGTLFLLDNYNVFFFPYDIFSWQYFLIALGLIFLSISNNKTAGVILIAVGLFNLVPELWPLIFVGIGLLIIFRKRGYSRNLGSQNSGASENFNNVDIIEEVNIFGGGNKVINSSNFKGGSILSLFGGSEVNLANCKLAEGENTLDVTFIFGGSTLIVPTDWKIEHDVMAVFGGFGDKRRKDPNMVYDDKKVLFIKGFVLFGGGEIKNY
jgi:predicted membrane protein